MFSISDLGEDRTNWPFKNMKVGDLVSYDFEDGEEIAKKAQTVAHIFGSYHSIKFKTRTVKKDGKKYMVIARIK